MQILIALLFGALVGYFLAREYYTNRTAPPQPRVPEQKPAPEPAPVAVEAKPDDAKEAPLSTRLHAISNVMTPFAEGTAHPNELRDNDAFKEAVEVLADPKVAVATVIQYATGANWTLSCAALSALAKREDRQQASAHVLLHFSSMRPWPMYFAFDYFSALSDPPPVGAPAVYAEDWWAQNPMLIGFFREYLDRCEAAKLKPEFGDAFDDSLASPPEQVERFLKALNHPLCAELIRALNAVQRAKIDRTFLSGFGRFWKEQDDGELLHQPDIWKSALDLAAAAIKQNPPRSIYVTGERGVGKTSFLRLLNRRLMAEGWTVFEASAADIMAGQKYIGEIEGRIRQMLTELEPGKKLIWYLPDLLAAARSGQHSGQAHSILDQIVPAISGGRLIVMSEATPASATRLFQSRPGLRSTFELIRLEPHSDAETLHIAGIVAVLMEVEIGLVADDDDCVPIAHALARQYLATNGMPGAVLDLLKLSANRAISEGRTKLKPDDVLATLAALTGLPTSILNTKERIDLDAIRAYFGKRVIGQPEAVNSVVDRIAMLKAGLTDPSKPIGVFLFAGPTGTGKTELAKTLAEFLFASTDRMIRLDMSEYQTPESLEKIIGTTGGSDAASLIDRVRKQPFSVVLLDEFEKAHAKVWDLFLQVFDDGRLTDTQGQTADLRHCIIILTTNLGATSHRGADLGFTPGRDEFSNEQVLRAIGQTFRPEFQNRLDKVIVFRPLTRDLMRGILKKELNLVLHRRGFQDREWAVEWEESAQEFLLEKGFTPEMGARPLKRAIDHYVLAPLAATIVERRFPEGDQFVFMRSDGKAIKAEFVDPDAETKVAHTPRTGGPSLEQMIFDAEGCAQERDALDAAWAKIQATLDAPEWEARKERLSLAMAEPEFWSKPARHETLSHYALIDRVKAAAQTAASLRARLEKSAARVSAELIERQALQIHLLNEGIADVAAQAPIEAALIVEPVFDDKAGAEWCARIAAMYRGWASKRHMQLTEASDGKSPVLLVSGFGAFRLLSAEAGLHVFDPTEDASAAFRIAARVRVAPAPLGNLSPAQLRAALADIVKKAPKSDAILRRYRGGASPLVRDAKAGWRSGKFDEILAGDFDLIGALER